MFEVSVCTSWVLLVLGTVKERRELFRNLSLPVDHGRSKKTLTIIVLPDE